ncbi:MAG: family hydrolase, diverged [Oscillospiraceae bacterium]|nr:family hydrolase, diverged [Oscillospiraceae bacterium]
MKAISVFDESYITKVIYSMSYLLNYESYVGCVSELLKSQTVQSMRRHHHHCDISCYEHSVFVSYVAFRMARRLKCDYQAAARGGLLHDLYLYDPDDKSAHPGYQCFDHPVAAWKNAKELCDDLTPKEENIILSHMWPMARHRPHSREAVLVSLADKFCATVELLHLFHVMRRRDHLPAVVKAISFA